MEDDKNFEDPHASVNSDATEPREPHEETKSTISADLIRGHINTIILRTLDERDKYGYEIINEIEEKSHGQYSIKQPTLYSALKRLETQGYIKAYWKTDEVSSGGRRKYFTLTELGREFSEKNQSEWEYSRTVIDSLISDRSFDFSQPAPTTVDFNILKKSVTRVYTGGNRNDRVEHEEDDTLENSNPDLTLIEDTRITYDDDMSVQNEYTGQSVHDIYVERVPEKIITEEKNNDSLDSQSQETLPHNEQAPLPEVQPVESIVENSEVEQQSYSTPVATEDSQSTYFAPHEESTQPQNPIPELTPVIQPVSDQIYEQQPDAGQPEQQTYTGTDDKEEIEVPRQEVDTRSEEERRRTHENFIRLMTDNNGRENDIVPNSDNIDTDKLIYTNRPETERDYKKLVDNIFKKTLKTHAPNYNVEPENNYQQSDYTTQAPPPVPAQPTDPISPEPPTVIQPRHSYPTDPVIEKAKQDGLKINTSSSSSVRIKGHRGTTYNKGGTLFASSIVVGIILLLEFIVCISVMNTLNVSIMYPLAVLIIALAQLIVFGITFACGYGRSCVRPTTHRYIILCVVLNIIAILIICLVSFLLNIDFDSINDVAAKLIIPIIISLNLTIFGVSYYFISK